MPIDFYLSSKSLKQVKETGIESDFVIVIFDKEIQCSKFVASFLSPKISQLIRSDITFSKFLVSFPSQSLYYSSHDELKSMINRTDFISKLINLLDGEPFQYDVQILNNQSQNNENISDISRLLIEFGLIFGNTEFVDEGIKSLNIMKENEEITVDNFIAIIKLNNQFPINKMIEKAIKYFASNFYKLFEGKNDKESIQKIPKEYLELILSSNELKIESEDSLFELVFSLGSKFFYLFDYIEIQYLSTQNIQKLIDTINNYFISLHPRLWHSICHRLILDPSLIGKQSNPRAKSPDLIECKDGIFEYFRNNVNQNFYESKVIDVTVTKNYCGDIKNLFDKSKSTIFRLNDRTNDYITFDFKKYRVNVAKYSFSVPDSNNGWSNGQPKSWKIEASDDKQSWQSIDQVDNDTSLNGYGNSHTYTCKNATKKYYRFIRIKGIQSQYNDNNFLLSEIEFYGSIQNGK